MGFSITIKNQKGHSSLSVGYNSGDYATDMQVKKIAHELKNSLDDLHEARNTGDNHGIFQK